MLKARGRTSIELKHRYVIDPSSKRRRERYTTDVHFFLPGPFRITPDTYNRERFYADAKRYLRFDTPVMGVETVIATGSADSPLARLEHMVERVPSDRALPEDEFTYESKLLAAIYKSLLRRMFGGLSPITQAAASDIDPSDPYEDDAEVTQSSIDGRISAPAPDEHTLLQVHEVLLRFHDLTRLVVETARWEPAHDHCRMIDEHLSLLLERYLTRYVRIARARGDVVRQKERVRSVIADESVYRYGMGYPSTLRDQADEYKLEEYVYREKMLKMYSSEVLFLRVRTLDESRRVEHLLYAGAAGIAMVFATAIGFYAQSVFGGISAALFGLLVVSYMIKDRLKDVFRALFRRSAGGRFYDRRTTLRDSARGSRVGSVRERVGFVGRKHEDPIILRARARGPFEAQLDRSASETHLVHHKVVTIRAKTLRTVHNRIRGLADILILDLEPMFRSLAAQTSFVPIVDGSELSIREAHRVYHLSLVVDSRGPGGRNLSRFRLVVDHDGIRRIETVPIDRTQSSELV